MKPPQKPTRASLHSFQSADHREVLGKQDARRDCGSSLSLPIRLALGASPSGCLQQGSVPSTGSRRESIFLPVLASDSVDIFGL